MVDDRLPRNATQNMADEESPLSEPKDSENTPLLESSSDRLVGSVRKASSRSLGAAVEFFQDTEDRLSWEYDAYDLGTWKALKFTTGTIWKDPNLGTAMRRLFLVSITTAVIEFCVSTDPRSIDVHLFANITMMLKAFVAFLLGFFLTSAVNRWNACATCFFRIADCARNLHVLLHGLGVPEARINHIKRYSIVSLELLTVGMTRKTPEGESQTIGTSMFDATELEAKLHDCVKKGMLQEEEEDLLLQLQDCTATMWVWIISLLCRAAQDGELPPMSSPTFGKLVACAERADDEIRQVHLSSKVQMPFVYVHLLAFLVHVNNILASASFGLTLGTSCAAILSRMGITLYGRRLYAAKGDAVGSIPQDATEILVGFISTFSAMLLYSMTLQIGLLLTQPFANPVDGVSTIPMHKIVQKLERDLDDISKVATNTFGWERPIFARPGK